MPNYDPSLGVVSERYETGGNGPGTISSGKNDAGGKSYGLYQFASKRGRLKTSTVSVLQEFLDTTGYGKQFAGLALASTEFDAKWKQLADSDPAFAVAQHTFIAITHYQPALDYAASLGFPVDDRRIQEMIWSGSVQHRGINDILKSTANMINVSSAKIEDVITTYYAARTAYTNKTIPNDPNSGRNRYKKEVASVLGLVVTNTTTTKEVAAEPEPQLTRVSYTTSNSVAASLYL